MTRLISLTSLALLTALACDDSAPARRPPAYPPGPPPLGPGPAPGPTPSGPPLAPAEISDTVNAAYPQMSDCYMKSVSYMTGKSGNVTIFFDVAPTGSVVRATDQPPPGILVQGSPLADAKLTECLVSRFFGLRFRAASEATAASWMFTFSP